MRVWIVAHKNYAVRPENLDGWSMVDRSEGGFYVNAVHAFLRKKHADEYILSLPHDIRQFRKIVTFDSTQRAEQVS